MTREEAIRTLQTSNEYHHARGDMPHSAKSIEAFGMAIKALEQEPVLDKIRAEIEQVKSIINEEIIDHNRKDLINFVNGLNQSLVIIDKHKPESEDKE